MDLAKAFAVDEAKQEKGVWHRLYSGGLLIPIDNLPNIPVNLQDPEDQEEAKVEEKLAEFLIRSFESDPVQRLLESLTHEYQAVLLPGHPMARRARREIDARVAGEGIIGDWRNVEIDGATQDYSPETAVGAMRRLSGLRGLVYLASRTQETFKPRVPDITTDEAGKKTS